MKSSLPLTAKYRPQFFSEVAGQATIKTILSRASEQKQVAPAYLFSGTRGVGKTTIARIFAKALNCERGPGPEPCNQCDSCRQITQGMAIDVSEIDGASNRGIDDAKRLKEDIGYAPLEGRYKIFIIDEAHMLTREAFNALLKTLEEPPAKVTFILATTEPHKFPATIISRCQHFTFKQLVPQELKNHLTHVLQSESVEYEEEAVNLLVRRAAGSVRDGMSLLGQVLALGQGSLSIGDVQNVLGLAGQDLFLKIIEATVHQDPLLVAEVVETLLDQGVDMGFFLRELTLLWRNLFMLKQVGEKAITLLNFSQEEAQVWLEAANELALPHIHASWQMTLEGQRRVLDSLEPGQALELLLLNIAMLPSLIPVSDLPEPGAMPGLPGGQAKQRDSGQEVTRAEVRRPETAKTESSQAGQMSEKSTSPSPDQTITNLDAEPGQQSALASDVKQAEPAQKKTPDIVEELNEPISSSEKADLDNETKPFPEVVQREDTEAKPVDEPEKPTKSPGHISSPSPLSDSENNWQENYDELAGSEFSDSDMVFGSDDELADLDIAGGKTKDLLPAESATQKRIKAPELAEQAETDKNDLKQQPALAQNEEVQKELSADKDVFADSLATMQWEKFLEFCQSKRSGQIPMPARAGENGLDMGSENFAVPTFPEVDDDDNLEVLLENFASDFSVSGQGAEPGEPGDSSTENHLDAEKRTSNVNPVLLNKGRGAMHASKLWIECPSDISFEHLCQQKQRDALSYLAKMFCGRDLELEILPPQFRAKTRGDLRREAQEHRAVLLLKEKMGAYLLDCIPEHEQG